MRPVTDVEFQLDRYPVGSGISPNQGGRIGLTPRFLFSSSSVPLVSCQLGPTPRVLTGSLFKSWCRGGGVSFLSDLWISRFGPTPVGTLSLKQSSWDRPGILADKDQVWSSLHTSREKAIHLAASAPHSGSWLTAMPIATCGLRFEDEAVRIGVALRLGLPLCVAHD